jgi:signal peptidase I
VNRPAVSTMVLFALVLVAWLTVVPTTFGGPATYVRVRGESMLPTFEPGAMVMLRKQDDYAIGDVLAFRAKNMNDAVLIHRVVGMDETGTRFLMQGDNTNFIDAYHPLPEDVLGVMVFSVPDAGRLSSLLQSPIGFGSLAGLAGATLFLGGEGRRRRRTRSYSYQGN